MLGEHIGRYRLSNNMMTVSVITRNGKITEAPEDLQAFVGLPLDTLACCMDNLGVTTVTQLEGHTS
jgi:hypothetical protein